MYEANPIHIPAPRMLAIAKDQIIKYVKSKWVVTISNPGSIPIKIKPPKSNTLLPEPGIPNNKVGINAPPSFALFADSGAITPLISPFPNFEVSFVVYLRWL